MAGGQTPLQGLRRDGRVSSAPVLPYPHLSLPRPLVVGKRLTGRAAAAVPHPETKQERFLESQSWSHEAGTGHAFLVGSVCSQ